MTVRQFWAIIILVGVMTAGRHLVGEGFVVAYFAIVGLTGLLVSILYGRERNRLHRELTRLSDEERERALVRLENVPFRPELAAELGRPMPRVPLRGERERFGYPDESLRVSRWIMGACAFMAAFAALGWLSDVVLGRTTFVGRTTPRWEMAALIAMFGGGAALMRWSMRESAGVLEVTDEALSWLAPGRPPRRIPWGEVIEAGRGTISRAFFVRSRDQRIRFSYLLTDYGRAINLVATRLPPGTPWKGG